MPLVHFVRIKRLSDMEARDRFLDRILMGDLLFTNITWLPSLEKNKTVPARYQLCPRQLALFYFPYFIIFMSHTENQPVLLGTTA